MDTIESFLSYFKAVRKRTNKLLEVIPRDQFDFTYRPGKFTIADHIRHIAAIERYMFAETVSGRKSLYRGCGSELGEGYGNVLNFFNQAYLETLDIISRLNDTDLQRNCCTPAGIEINIRKWLYLMTEHEIHHRAELYIYMNILGVQTPPIYGMTSEELIKHSI